MADARTSAHAHTSADVLVIGAGVAGIAAAKKLSQQGLSVLVIEAQSDIGGRTRVTHALGHPLDLGASWLHGIGDHPLYRQARKTGMAHMVTDYDSLILFQQNGEIEPTSLKHIDKFERVLEKLGRDAKRKESIADRLPTLHSKWNERIPEALQRFLIATVLEEEFAADIEQLAAKALEEGRDMRGADAILRDAYIGLLAPMAAELDVRLETVVSEIAVQDDRVTVATSNGRFRADQVVLTAPLGVLKHNSIRITPPLSATHQDAIDSLGMGLTNKLYLRFPRVFWDPSIQVMGYQSAQPGRWLSWYDYATVSDQPILLGFCAAAAAAEVEALDDHSTVAEAMAVLRTIYGQDIPDPEAFVVTRWGQDPFSLGSYSYLKVGARSSQRDDLAKPFKDRLLIAGEATDRRYPSTTHGAWRAGRKAAKSVLKLRELPPRR